jgi:hypothetical protein
MDAKFKYCDFTIYVAIFCGLTMWYATGKEVGRRAAIVILIAASRKARVEKVKSHSAAARNNEKCCAAPRHTKSNSCGGNSYSPFEQYYFSPGTI